MRKILKKYLPRHFSFSGVFESTREEDLPQYRHHSARNPRPWVIFALRMLPYLCLILFGVSFAFDFGPADGFELFGYFFSLQSILRIASVSGLIGYGTNYVAIRMLFKPAVARPIWGQGLIPAQKDQIIDRIAAAIHRNILSEELIRQRIRESGLIVKINEIMNKGTQSLLQDEEFRTEVKDFIREYLKGYIEREDIREKFSDKIDEKLEENLQSGLKGLLFRLYRSTRGKDYQEMLDKLILGLPDSVVEGIESMEGNLPEFAEYLEEQKHNAARYLNLIVRVLLSRIDIASILRNQMGHIDEQKLEKMIREATNQQLLYIQYLGCLLGLLGGLLIWQPVLMLGAYAGLGLFLYLLDQYIYSQQRKSGPI